MTVTHSSIFHTHQSQCW